MIRILWTPFALEDLQGISAYLESRSTLARANRVCRKIYEAVQRLRQFPGSGRVGLEEETREVVVAAYPAYVIVYRISTPNRIEVLRIWHAAQSRVG